MIANHADLIARLRAFLKVWGGAGELQLYPALISTANEVADALASCEAAMEGLKRERDDLRRKWVDLHGERANWKPAAEYWMRKAQDDNKAAESALATERARVVEECARIAEIVGGHKVLTSLEGRARVAGEVAAAIRALIPATPGATEPSTSTASEPGSIATCEDCPPVGYPTDKTRCAVCPYRAPPYGEWCRNPKACAGKGYCPLDPTCGD